MSDIVERLRDYKKRFIFQGASQFALSLAADIERLRSRVEKLEKVRAAAQDLEGYGFGWLHWEEKFEALRAALKEAKP
jgi:hypothetical protein